MSQDVNQHSPSRNPPDPTAETDDSLADDPRLLKLMQEYLRELESGRQPDRRQWSQRYPDLAEALGPFLEGLELVHRAAPLASPLLDGSARVPSNTTEPLAAQNTRNEALGDFQIVREIGRGGMGIVYEAIQLSLGRRVALKVLPLAATFDARQLQRFQQEAQAAAHLHHANIVPVYGVGCQRGVHFYAMQLVEGQSLDVVVRQLRQEAGMDPLEAGLTERSSSAGNRESSASSAVDQTGDWKPTAAVDATLAPPPVQVRSDRPHAGALLGPFFHPQWRQAAGAVSDDRQVHGASGGSPRICASAGHRASRHQAGEPPDRLPRQRLDRRLRPGPLP